MTTEAPTITGCVNVAHDAVDCLRAGLRYFEWCEVCTPAILAGRKAKCSYYPRGGKCGRCPEPVDSRPGLAFFEYLGPLSEDALTLCTCGMRDITHPDVAVVNPHTGRRNTGHAFTARGPADFDRYFCGCWGWD